MSKIGKIPITIKEGVKVSIEENGKILISGPKGTLSGNIPQDILVRVEDEKIVVSQKKESETTKAIFGLTRSLINNMVKGVSIGFQKKLELSGVGYRAQVVGGNLSLSVGFSHPVLIAAPQNIQFSLLDNTIIISGIDKMLVGNVAASVRAVRVPEPYKGKGIKYEGERIRRKAGKAAKAVGAKV